MPASVAGLMRAPAVCFAGLALIALVAAAPTIAEEKRAEGAQFISATVAGEPRTSGRVEPGRPARLSVSVRDPASGFALGGLGIAAWIVPDDGTSCQDWYARVGRASQLPDQVIPLIGFDIIQATRDRHVALVDPVLDLASANLRAVTAIRALPSAWAITRDGDTLGMIGGQDGALTLADAALRRLTPVALPAPAHSLTAVEEGFWVGLRDGRAVPVDGAGRIAATVPVGSGAVTVLADRDDRLIALSADGQGRGLQAGAPGFRLPGPVGAAVLAPLANSLFALAADGRTLYAADLDEPSDVRRLPLAFAADRIAADPTGRWVALADAAGTTIAIVDTRTTSVRWSMVMPDPVIEMTFSDAFLYFMHRRQGGVTRVTFDADGAAPGLAAIAAGMASDVPQVAGPLPHLVRIPAGGVLVASSRERRAYIVSESGAQAAMAMVPLRAGETAGIAIRQRGMVPAKARGSYVASFTAPAEGAYRAVIRTDSPDLLQCRSFVVGTGRPRMARARPVAAVAATEMQVSLVETGIRLTLSDATVPARALLMRADGSWRSFLDPVRQGDGFLLATRDRAAPGAYRLFVEVIAADGTVATLSRDLAL
jgi:hypothetical protein